MELLSRAVARVEAGEALALVTVIQVRGSAPRHVGAKMLVTADGALTDTIGGGRVEREVTETAARVAAGAPAQRVEHHLVRDLAMCCGGSMSFYIEPIAPSLPALRQALARWQERQPVTLITPLDGGPKRMGEAPEPGHRHPVHDGARLIEPFWPRARVLLFGAGHVSRAIAPLAAGVGFDVVMCDDDDTGAASALGQPAWLHRLVESFDVRDVVAALGPLGTSDYALIVTRDHAVDQTILEQLLPNEGLTYLGLIASRGKIGRFRKRLEAKGIATEARWSRLHAPIGLDIGAETPEEIAVSVVAELVQVRNQGQARAGRHQARAGAAAASTGAEPAQDGADAWPRSP